MVRMSFSEVDQDYWGVGIIIDVVKYSVTYSAKHGSQTLNDDVCVYWTGKINKAQWEISSMLEEVY